MREWVINNYTGYEGLTLQECPEQEPAEGEVRIRVEAFALNWGDADLMLDNYTFSFPEMPARVGIECSGIVDKVGAGVTNIDVGQRYCTLPYMYFNRGVSADSIIVDPKYIVKAPAGLSAVQSASIWMKYMTAYFPLIELSKVNENSFVLVTAATGTAGKAGVEIARMAGAKVIATSRYKDNTSYLHDAGADYVYTSDDTSQSLAEVISDVTAGKGVNVVYDPVGGKTMADYGPGLAQDSRIYYYGFLTGEFPEFPLLDLFNNNTIFHPYSVFHYVAKPDVCAEAAEFIYRGIDEGKLSAEIDRVYPMTEYRDAWDYMRSKRSTHGKIIVETGFKP